MEQPNAACTDASVWVSWIEHLVATDGKEFTDQGICEEDVYHDLAQSVMSTIEDPAVVAEVSRMTGVETYEAVEAWAKEEMRRW